jgi:hypothetical protein
VSLVGQGETTGVAQHVRMSLELEAGYGASALHHAGETGGGEWGATF